ncbi:MAG: hypothetical protein PF501_15915 [Salinisphaera sp.]|nr:hypothetical protein [Salinisphaera sp.]
MKPSSRSYLIAAVLIFVSLVAGCALMPPSREAQASAANQVVADYKVDGLLAQAAPAVTDSLRRNLPDSVSASQRQQLDQSITAAYDAQRMRESVVSRLSKAAAQSDHQKYLIKAAKELGTPLAQRMINLERKVSDPHFGDGFQAFMNKPAGTERKARLKIIDQLADDMVVTDLQTNFNVALLKGMIQSRNTVVDSSQTVGSDQKQRILSNSRDGIRAKLNQQVPRMLLYVYRDVDTDTLKKYAALQHQPEMVWTNHALADAVTHTLSDAGDRVSANPKQKD